MTTETEELISTEANGHNLTCDEGSLEALGETGGRGTRYGAKQPKRHSNPKRKGKTKRKRTRYKDTSDSSDDDDLLYGRQFDVMFKLTSDRFSPENYNCVKELKGEELTLENFQRNGFDQPLLIKVNQDNVLGMKMPSDSFTVEDVKNCVGPRRILDVMNVETQKDDTMTMKDWCTYYTDFERKELLNVISLEFSHTKLEQFVDSPSIVKQMDWVDLVWPRHLKRMQKEGTNSLHDMKYPKVQKYCLMSVKGCYTDFHIDFGGTSVWYHILRGRKVFWLIPPTEMNIQLYERWTLSGRQSDIFFGDTVTQCCRVNLEAGNTFFIPTGWIHAVYTLEDSLVFGGNFLHSYGIEKQLRVWQVEDLTKVPLKFRYPFFTELLWYVLARYVHCLMGRNHLRVDDDGRRLKYEPKKSEDKKSVEESSEMKIETQLEKIKVETSEEIKEEPPKSPAESVDSEATIEDEWEYPDDQEEEEKPSVEEKKLESDQDSETPLEVPYISFHPVKCIHLARQEISGLKALIDWLEQLPPSKKSVPNLLVSPEKLLVDARRMIDEHATDEHEKSITNQPRLFWLTRLMAKEFREIYRRQRIQEEKLKAQQERQRKAEAKEVAKAEKEAARIEIAAKKAAAAAAAAQREMGDHSYYRMQPINRMQPSNGTTKIASGKTLQLPSSLQGLIAQSSVKPVGYNNGNYLISPILASITLPVASSNATNTATTCTSEVLVVKPVDSKPKSVHLEHTYNQSPLKYSNPHYPHNYAYHPHSRPIFESSTGGVYHTNEQPVAYSVAATSYQGVPHSPPFMPHSPRKPPPPLTGQHHQQQTNGSYWPREVVIQQQPQQLVQQNDQLQYSKSVTYQRPVEQQQQSQPQQPQQQHILVRPFNTVVTMPTMAQHQQPPPSQQYQTAYQSQSSATEPRVVSHQYSPVPIYAQPQPQHYQGTIVANQFQQVQAHQQPQQHQPFYQVSYQQVTTNCAMPGANYSSASYNPSHYVNPHQQPVPYQTSTFIASQPIYNNNTNTAVPATNNYSQQPQPNYNLQQTSPSYLMNNAPATSLHYNSSYSNQTPPFVGSTNYQVQYGR